jgi:hypothetical protein
MFVAGWILSELPQTDTESIAHRAVFDSLRGNDLDVVRPESGETLDFSETWGSQSQLWNSRSISASCLECLENSGRVEHHHSSLSFPTLSCEVDLLTELHLCGNCLASQRRVHRFVLLVLSPYYNNRISRDNRLFGRKPDVIAMFRWLVSEPVVRTVECLLELEAVSFLQ